MDGMWYVNRLIGLCDWTPLLIFIFGGEKGYNKIDCGPPKKTQTQRSICIAFDDFLKK